MLRIKSPSDISSPTGSSNLRIKSPSGTGGASPLSSLDRQAENYQTRFGAVGQQAETQDSFAKKSLNNLVKALDIIDRPRNALFNAVEDMVKKENTFGQGFMEGLKGEEYYTGTDAFVDLTGGKKAETTLGKVGQFAGGLGLEIFGDPLNYLTMGAGSLLKGALGGTAKTLSKEAMEAGVRGSLHGLTDDAFRSMKNAVYNNMKSMPGVPDEALSSLARLEKSGITGLANIIDDVGNINPNRIPSDLWQEAKHVTSFVDETASKSWYKQADNLLKNRGIDMPAKRYNYADMQKAMMESAERANKAILTDPKLGGRGVSVFGKTLPSKGTPLTGARMQDVGADWYKKAIGSKAETHMVASKIDDMFTGARTVFSKHSMPGASPEVRAFTKGLYNSLESSNRLADDMATAFSVKWRDQVTGAIRKQSPDLKGNALLKEVEKYEAVASDFINLKSTPNLIDMDGVTPEMNDVLNIISGDIEQELYSMGMKEAEIGSLKYIMDDYTPLVKNLDITTASKSDIMKMKRQMGKDPDDIFGLGNVGGTSMQDFGVLNVSRKKRANPDSVRIANKLKMVETSSPEVRADFFEALFRENPALYNTLEKHKILKVGQSGRYLDRKAIDDKSYNLIEEFSDDLLNRLDGLEHFYETSAVKSYLVRAVRHNSILKSNDTIQGLLHGVGIKIDPYDAYAKNRALRNNYDIIVTRSYTSTVSDDTLTKLMGGNFSRAPKTQLDRLLSAKKAKFDKIKHQSQLSGRHITGPEMEQMEDLLSDMNALRTELQKIEDGVSRVMSPQQQAKMAGIVGNLQKDAMMPLDRSAVDELVGLFDSNEIPLEIWAVPKGVRKEYNTLARKQVDDGFKSMTNIIDSLHRIWKPLVTGLRPDFHLRNYISSNVNDAIGNGIKAIQPQYKALGNKIARNTDGTIKIAGDTFSVKMLHEEMQKRGAFSTMYRSVYDDALDMALSKNIKSTGRSMAHKARDVYETATHKVGNVVEDNVRATNFVINMEKSLKSGMDTGHAMDYAVEQVKKFHFDYSDLSEVERNLFRRVVPFYTWSRKNIPLQMETFLNDPGFYGKIGSLQQSAEQSFGGGMENMPDWAKEGLPIATPFKSASGNTTYLSGLFPQSDMSRVMSSPLDMTKDLMNMASPLFKTPAELALNRSFLSGAPIYQTEYEKGEKMLGHVGSQLGAIRDVSRGVQGGENVGAYRSINYENPVMRNLSQFTGLTRSVLKEFDVSQGEINKMYEYLRYLSDYKQGLEQQGMDVPTLEEIRKDPSYLLGKTLR